MIAVLKKPSGWMSVVTVLSLFAYFTVRSGAPPAAEPERVKPADATAVKMAPHSKREAAGTSLGGTGTKEDKFFSFLEPGHFRSIDVVATGYYAGRESTGKSPGHPEYGITYSGVKVRKALFSTIAADPRIFPIGTILYIPGYGYGVVADTGSAIKGYKIDLYFETKRQIYEQWGKKKVRVAVLKRGNGRVTEAMMRRLNDAEAVVRSSYPPEV